ncbi:MULTISPECIES: hypothetical protein [unclassified Nocardiopsis]|uniref:hypothetical protein n=1 Tax=Nocardiopsis TaxID=2013 RepID=UPI00387B8D47
MNGIHLDDLLDSVVEALDLSGVPMPPRVARRISAVRVALEHARNTDDAHEALQLLDLALETHRSAR